LQEAQNQTSKRFRIVARVANTDTFWILCTIVLPLAGIIVELFARLSARPFLESYSMIGFILFFSLILLSILIGKWLFNGTDGIAIGISMFFAALSLTSLDFVEGLLGLLLCGAIMAQILLLASLAIMAVAELIFHAPNIFGVLWQQIRKGIPKS
jgi:hypothetical protein